MGTDPSHHTSIFHLPEGQEARGTQRAAWGRDSCLLFGHSDWRPLLGQTSVTASGLLGLNLQRVGLCCQDSI